ncbi:MAG: glycosyltransferase [Bryobacteraceae bacterium]|jgi:glycosyltransferase involved in cell wall biosynthesis
MALSIPAVGLLLAHLAAAPFDSLDPLPVVPQETGAGIVPEVLIPLALLCGLLIVLLGWWSRRQYLALPQLPSVADRTSEDHVVVIPARNEQSNIVRAVAGFPDSLVCVVDDASSDRTAEPAAAAGAHVIHAGPRAPGWLGKNNACWTGAQGTESKWILFADADTVFDPRFLHSLLEYARANSLQAVSVFPKPVGGTWLARLLLPCASGLSFTGLNAARINSLRSRQSLQNGQCLLFLRSGYDFIGGHRRVCRSITADLTFAGLLQIHRLSCRTLRCESLAAARRYDSAAALWSGLLRYGCRFLAVTPGVRLRLAFAWFVQATWLPVLLVLLYSGYYSGAALLYAAVVLAWFPWYGATPLLLFAPWAVYVVLAGAKLGLVWHFFGLSIGWKGRRV